MSVDDFVAAEARSKAAERKPVRRAVSAVWAAREKVVHTPKGEPAPVELERAAADILAALAVALSNGDDKRVRAWARDARAFLETVTPSKERENAPLARLLYRPRATWTVEGDTGRKLIQYRIKPVIEPKRSTVLEREFRPTVVACRALGADARTLAQALAASCLRNWRALELPRRPDRNNLSECIKHELTEEPWAKTDARVVEAALRGAYLACGKQRLEAQSLANSAASVLRK